jgi:hypothetical protein
MMVVSVQQQRQHCQRAVRRGFCLLSTCDIVFMNNWAFDDVFANNIVAQYGQRAPTAVALCSFAVRHLDIDLALLDRWRCSSYHGSTLMSTTCLPTASTGAHTMGVRQQSSASVSRKFRKMSESIY